jgi:hypothetical protein
MFDTPTDPHEPLLSTLFWVPEDEQFVGIALDEEPKKDEESENSENEDQEKEESEEKKEEPM